MHGVELALVSVEVKLLRVSDEGGFAGRGDEPGAAPLG